MAMNQMNQVLCGGCQIMLMYPQGAANVRCSQCQHVTPVAAPPGPTPPTSAPPTSAPPGGPPQQQGQAPRAQLQCAGCQIMLMYPRGAANVQCAVCGVVSSAAQANTVAHLQCTGCRTWLMYSYGARSVKCAVCETINKQIPSGDAAIPPISPMFQPGAHQPNGVQGPPTSAAVNGASPPNGVNGAAAAGPGGDPGSTAADGGAAIKQEPPENTPPVVVQNPVTVDEKGNKVEEVMLGYKDTGT